MATHENSSKITILAFDTSMEACSVAVSVDEAVIASKHETMRRGQAERLLPMIEEVCSAADVPLGNLDYIATTIGPGSFTGVRVGLAAAKGLALVTDAELIPLSTTEAIAASMEQQLDGRLIIALDARRDQIYLQHFQIENQSLIIESEASMLNLVDLATVQPTETGAVAGDGGRIICDYWPDLEFLGAENGAANAVRFIKYAHTQVARATAAKLVQPLYLRPPDAKLPATRNT